MQVLLTQQSRVRLFATLWAVACQAPLSMEFSKQEYWSGLPFPSQEIFPTQTGIEFGLPALQAASLPSEPLFFKNMDTKNIAMRLLNKKFNNYIQKGIIWVIISCN